MSSRGGLLDTFPRIQIKPSLWEFAGNRIYDFQNGMIEERPVNPFISCSKYHEALWQQLPHPQPVLHLVEQLIARPMELEPFLISLGALFHPLTKRKNQPAVWLWGNSNTFKTFFTKTFLEHNFSEVLIHYIEQSKQSQFKYGRIRGLTEGIILIDDFRDASIGQVTQFINLVNGQPVVLDDKYKQQQRTKFKGHPVITTNKSIQQTNLQIQDQSALTKRFSQTEFECQGNSWDQINELFDHITPNHWLSFGIYVNRLYLKRNGCINPAKPNNWRKSLPLPDQQPQNENWHQWLNPFGFKT
jgi:Papillomavirus helicase